MSATADGATLGPSTVSTEKGFVERHGPLRTVWNDEYLRAVWAKGVDKEALFHELVVFLRFEAARTVDERAAVGMRESLFCRIGISVTFKLLQRARSTSGTLSYLHLKTLSQRLR